MISPALLTTLTKLKNNRLLSGEAKSALAPFIGKAVTLPLALVSSSRTFGNPFDPVYDDGHTLVCRLEGEEIEVTVLLGSEENDRVEGLVSDETFETKLTVLDFDALYQRAIFGQLLPPSSISEEQEEVIEEPQTQISTESEPRPATSVVSESPSVSKPDEILLPEPEEIPHPTDTSEHEQPSQEAEIEISTAVEPPPPQPSPSTADHIPEKNPKVETCPKGHGPLEPMAGKMICWTCGWPEQKESEQKSTHSLKSNRLKKDLDWIRNKGQKAQEERSVKKPNEENKGCSGCRIILGSLFLLISLVTCSGGSVGGGFIFLLLGLACCWPLMKKWFGENLSDS
ncbi:MAG: hypothetical protein CMI26_13560 [Opitutae bacterium]|jgi:hypothetical protein|nr:hypothetical protein [Opitutae bacterium]